MSNKSIEPRQLEEVINKQLQLWSNDVQMGVCKLVDEKAEKLKKLIKDSAPVGRRGGKYKKSWRIKLITDKFSRYEKVVYASGHEYSLTHLLEKGHALKRGGRVAPRVHIAPARDQIEKEYISGVKSLIKNSQSGGGGYRSLNYKR